MEESTHSRTGLFMTELILVVLFFSITAACCLQAFGHASMLSEKTDTLKLALNSTENLIQQLKNSGGDAEALHSFYPEAEIEEEICVWFDEEGAPCSRDEASYHALITCERKAQMVYVNILCADQEGKEIYTVTAPVMPEDGS